MKAFDLPGAPIDVYKSTVISIVPFPIHEEKPGLIPGVFDIEASMNDEPVCYTIGESIHYVYIDKDRGSMRVRNPSYEVARSVVNDYVNSQLEAKPDCHPGIWWEPGEWTPSRVKAELESKLEDIKRIQNNWGIAIVRVADDDWEKTRSHYSISDTQRTMAKKLDPLNTRSRPWIMVNPSDLTPGDVKMTVCGACGSDIPVHVAICKFCRAVVDPAKYKQFMFAQENPDKVGIDLSKVRM